MRSSKITLLKCLASYDSGLGMLTLPWPPAYKYYIIWNGLHKMKMNETGMTFLSSSKRELADEAGQGKVEE